jgi:hypothetical protein
VGTQKQNALDLLRSVVHSVVASILLRLSTIGLRKTDFDFVLSRSSDLSLAISDYMSTPLLCTASSPWWTSIPQVQLPDSITHSQQKDDVCSRQGALVAFILLVTIMYTANMVLSLFRILERVRVLAKQYEKASAPQV